MPRRTKSKTDRTPPRRLRALATAEVRNASAGNVRVLNAAGAWASRTWPRFLPCPRHSLSFLLLTVLVLATSACTEQVSPVLNVERTFSLYGYLDPTADTQAVRVFPVEPLLRPLPGAPLGVEVTSTDLASGDERVWRDSVVQYSNGRFGNVYWSAFTPEHGADYRLVVRAPDGRQVSAEVRIPPRATPAVGESYRVNPDSWPADMRIPVAWKGHPAELVRVDLHYRVAYAKALYPDCFELRDTTVTVSDAVAPTRTADGWAVEVHLTKDQPRVADALWRQQIISSPTSGGLLLTLEMDVFVGDTGWIAPGGVFAAEVLAEPGLFSNVTGGFGFVGAGYRRRIDLPFDLAAPALAGFHRPIEYFSDENVCRDG